MKSLVFITLFFTFLFADATNAIDNAVKKIKDTDKIQQKQNVVILKQSRLDLENTVDMKGINFVTSKELIFYNYYQPNPIKF